MIRKIRNIPKNSKKPLQGLNKLAWFLYFRASFSFLLRMYSLHDIQKVFGDQGSTANQESVHILLCRQIVGIVGLHGA